jgi:hypothetical protein
MQYSEIEELSAPDTTETMSTESATLKARLMYLSMLPALPDAVPEIVDERFEVVDSLRTEYVALTEKLFLDHQELVKKMEKVDRMVEISETLRDEKYHAELKNLVDQFEKDEQIVEFTATLNKQLSRLRKLQKVLKVCSSESFTCFVCLENTVSVFLDPCGHVTCDICRDKIKKTCPFCRCNVVTKKIYTG